MTGMKGATWPVFANPDASRQSTRRKRGADKHLALGHLPPPRYLQDSCLCPFCAALTEWHRLGNLEMMEIFFSWFWSMGSLTSEPSYCNIPMWKAESSGRARVRARDHCSLKSLLMGIHPSMRVEPC
jgi:hypothetical protein